MKVIKNGKRVLRFEVGEEVSVVKNDFNGPIKELLVSIVIELLSCLRLDELFFFLKLGPFLVT
jgi:hypothetical protein